MNPVEMPGTLPSREERQALTRMLMQLFDHWGLSTEEQLLALGLAADNRAALSRYRRGEPISGSRDTLERVGHLLAIHKALRLLFPAQPQRLYGWIKRRNRAFAGRTPIEAIAEFGFTGLLMVRAYLDRARGR